MRVCDWIAEHLYQHGVRNVYGVTGGGAAGLNDGFISHGVIQYRPFHHEQGAARAAIGESKLTGQLAVVNPTTGCGSTNCATSVLNAWQDGVPVLFLSGNVKSDTCTKMIYQRTGIKLRKYGIQEHDIIETYRSTTKMIRFIDRVEDVAYYVTMAISFAESGRPGPVWLDIPSEIQTAKMPSEYEIYRHINFINEPNDPTKSIDTIRNAVSKAERPVVLIGNGILQSKTQQQLRDFVEKYQLPFVYTFGAVDVIEYDHPLNIGAVGIKGTRAANFAMQNADLLLVLGSSMQLAAVGYDPLGLAPASYKIYVDIDQNELDKQFTKIDLRVKMDLKDFFEVML